MTIGLQADATLAPLRQLQLSELSAEQRSIALSAGLAAAGQRKTSRWRAALSLTPLGAPLGAPPVAAAEEPPVVVELGYTAKDELASCIAKFHVRCAAAVRGSAWRDEGWCGFGSSCLLFGLPACLSHWRPTRSMQRLLRSHAAPHAAPAPPWPPPLLQRRRVRGGARRHRPPAV